MVDADQSGYLARALIGQNKGTLRPPAGLSRVSHPQVLSVYKCTEAGINSHITVPSKVCAPQVGFISAGSKNVRKKIVTLAGGCAPEASTLPPVTVSLKIWLVVIGKKKVLENCLNLI